MKNKDLDIKVGDLIKSKFLDRYVIVRQKCEGFVMVYDHEFDRNDFIDNDKIIEVKRPCQYKTVYKYKKPILDEKEKEYLSAVIKPFRNDVVSIKKLIFNDKKEYLKIDFKDIDYINFRNFKKGTMYKGMKADCAYTLEELGL